MSSAEHSELELVVDPDGGIRAEQLARLGIGPGAHLQVVRADRGRTSTSVAGTLSDLPELTWDDFQHGSELAKSDVNRA